MKRQTHSLSNFFLTALNIWWMFHSWRHICQRTDAQFCNPLRHKQLQSSSHHKLTLVDTHILAFVIVSNPVDCGLAEVYSVQLCNSWRDINLNAEWNHISQSDNLAADVLILVDALQLTSGNLLLTESPMKQLCTSLQGLASPSHERLQACKELDMLLTWSSFFLSTNRYIVKSWLTYRLSLAFLGCSER